MRWAAVFAGLALGLLAGLVAAAWNPLGFWQAPRPLDDATRALQIEHAAGRGLPAEPAALLGMVAGNDDSRLPDPALRFAAVDVAVLRDPADDGRALAVKMSTIARGNQLEQAQLRLQTTWNVFWPGHGSLFVAGEERHWARLVDGLGAMAAGEGFVADNGPYLLAGAVRGDEIESVIGASGNLESVRGRHEFWLEKDSGRLTLSLDAD